MGGKIPRGEPTKNDAIKKMLIVQSWRLLPRRKKPRSVATRNDIVWNGTNKPIVLAMAFVVMEKKHKLQNSMGNFVERKNKNVKTNRKN